jgi:hypothetical protein
MGVVVEKSVDQIWDEAIEAAAQFVEFLDGHRDYKLHLEYRP